MTPKLNFYDPERRPWPHPRLERTSIVGHTTPRSVRLWFRVSSAGNYVLAVSREPLPTYGRPLVVDENDRYQLRAIASDRCEQVPTVAIAAVEMTPTTDLTGVVDLDRLEPDTLYYYGLFHPHRDRPWELPEDEPLTFRTFPETATEICFGIYSCHMPYDNRELVNIHMWDAFYRELNNANARLVLGTGDQVYVDGTPELSIWHWLRKVQDHNPSREQMVEWYRDIYRGYWGIPEVQRIFRGFPNYMMWDDHEIVDGWGSYTPDELAGVLDVSWKLRDRERHLRLAHQMFDAAKQVYHEYQHSHNPPTDDAENRFDYEFDCAFCSFFILDMRGNHDFNRKEWGALGVQQWQRVQQWLDSHCESDSRALFIISPVPVVHLYSFFINNIDLTLMGYQDDQRDHWEHRSNWDERNCLLDKLFEFSQETGKPVVFLSGDVHIGAAFTLSHDRFPNAKIYQLTSSGITYAELTPFGRWLLEQLVPDRGTLGDRQGNPPYHFRKLAICRQNNFGIVRAIVREDGEVAIVYDLYGNDPNSPKETQKIRIEFDRLS